MDYKKLGMDIGYLEQFYANDGNEHRLCPPTAQPGDQNVTLPRLLAIPPQFVDFCVLGQKTPFKFHQYLTMVATALGAPVTLGDIQLMLDWCVMASHHDTQAHTSLMAFSLDAAFSTDETFNKWVQ
jgi:hypothetical protein